MLHRLWRKEVQPTDVPTPTGRHEWPPVVQPNVVVTPRLARPRASPQIAGDQAPGTMQSNGALTGWGEVTRLQRSRASRRHHRSRDAAGARGALLRRNG